MKMSLRFPLPPEPGASEALEAWEAVHRAEFTRLLLRFGKLHLAINAQKAGHGLTELKQDLSTCEDEMLEWYLALGDDVNKLKEGYGGPTVLSRYYAAIESARVHKENYRQLRSGFDAFLSN